MELKKDAQPGLRPAILDPRVHILDLKKDPQPGQRPAILDPRVHMLDLKKDPEPGLRPAILDPTQRQRQVLLLQNPSSSDRSHRVLCTKAMPVLVHVLSVPHHRPLRQGLPGGVEQAAAPTAVDSSTVGSIPVGLEPGRAVCV